MLEQRDLQRVAADSETAGSLLASARRHVDSARRTLDSDPEAAYTLAYDAARKSATALLAHQGLRPTSAGGHIVVVEVIRAQFPAVPGLSSLDRLRRRRNQAEYPDPKSYDPITIDEASDAIEVAARCASSAERLLELDELGVF
jgi:HEPN domain-containing protein